MTYSKLNILRNQPILISIQKKKLLSSKIKELISTHVLRTLNACINNVKGGVTCTLRVILISISHKYFYYYYTKTLIYHQGQSNKIESIELFLFTPFLLKSQSLLVLSFVYKKLSNTTLIVKKDGLFNGLNEKK